MAQGAGSKTLVIQELPEQQGGSSPDSGSKFELNRQKHSSHRGKWDIPVKVRTVREEYAGTDEVTEQVLGSHLEPFTLHGKWDARWSDPYSPTYALDTWREFEAMVRRGNLVRLSFETIQVTGIITDFLPSYDKEWLVDWSFTFSPHFKKQAGDVQNSKVIPKQSPTPRVVVASIVSALASMQQNNVQAPAPYMVGNLFPNVRDQVDQISAQVDRLILTMDNQLVPAAVIPGSLPANGDNGQISPLGHMVQSLESISAGATAVNYLLRGASNYSSSSFVAPSGSYALRAASSASLAYDLALPIIQFDVWRSGMSSLCRQMVSDSSTFAASLRERTKPGVQGIYITKPGESLYRISSRVYGNPNAWRDIYERNGLVQITMQGNEILVIPSRGNTS